MAAITTAVIGAVSLGYGLYSRYEAGEDAEEAAREQARGEAIKAEAARQMNLLSKEQAATSVDFANREFGLNKQASLDSLSAAQASQAINRQMIELGRQVEGERKQAMEMDGRRKQLEIIRNQQRARSMALTAATQAGSAQGSGILGGYGQISGQSGTNILGVQQNLQIGRNIFGLNSQITDQRIAASNLEDTYALQRFNSQNAKAQMSLDYATINANYQTRLADLQQVSSQGQGVVNRGQGMANVANAEANMANTFIGAAGTIASLGQPINNLYNNFSGGSGITNANPDFSWSNYTNPYYGPGY